MKSLSVAICTAQMLLATQLAFAGERVIYKRNPDRDLLMTIRKPLGWTAGDRRSAIIFFYNGGWKEPGATKPQFEEQARYFAVRGMVVAQADYREKSQGGVTSDKCVEDIFSAIRWLRSHAGELGLDPARIAAAGGSGSIHLPAAVFQADEIRAPGEDAGIDPLPGALFSFHPDPDVLDAAMMNRLVAGGAVPAGRRMPPTVVYWGSRDAVAPLLAEFVAKTRAAGLPVESHVGEGGVHGFYKFTPGLEATTEHMDQKLRALGFVSDEPRAEPPHKAAPPDYEQRMLATQQRWLERHNQLTKQRSPTADPEQAAPRAPKSTVPPTMPPPSSHIYRTFGARHLQLAMHYPAGWKKDDRRPVLLCFEGGGENPKDKDGKPYPLAAERARLGLPVVNPGPGRSFVPVADHFTKLGLVCICAEYRKRKTDGVLPDKAVEDAKSAVRWVRAHAAELGVDAARVVVTGASSGGHLAGSLAALKDFDAATDDLTVSCRPDALILHSPLLDFLEGGTRNTPFLAALDNDRALGERLSPARHWSRDMPPTLLFTGEKEPIFEMLGKFAKNWKSAGQPIELVTGAGGHVYSLNEKWLAETLPRMEIFLQSIGCLDASATVPRTDGARGSVNRDAASALAGRAVSAADGADPEVVGLAGQLRAEEFSARLAAATSLIERGADAQDVFPLLVQALADDEALDTVIAARALYAKSRPATDTVKLASALKFDTKARVSAAWELSRIGLPAGGQVTPMLIEALRNPDKHERNFILLALATTAPRSTEVMDALIHVLQDEGSRNRKQTNYKYPRATAAIALGMIEADMAKTVPTLIKILGEKDAWIYQHAANCFALGRIGPNASSALTALKQASQSASPVIRAHAERAIRAIATPNGGTASALATPQAEDVSALLKTLAGRPDRINLKFTAGLRALGKFAGTTKPTAKKDFRTTSPPIHESIALAIGFLDSLPQTPSPEEIVEQEEAGAFSDSTVRYLMALGGIQQGIAPTLLEALSAGEQDERVIAIRRLAALGPAADDAIPALTELLQDDDWLVRREAFLALVRISHVWR